MESIGKLVGLEELIAAFARRRLLLVGDTILDSYVYGTAIGKAPKTPTIVARELETTFSLGGAFLVARNMLALGAAVDFITLVGADGEADQVRQFTHPRLQTLVIADATRRTTVKKRFWVDGYKLLQFDTFDNRPIAGEVRARVEQAVDGWLPACDALVIADYRHGLLSDALIRALVEQAGLLGKPVYVDSQISQSASNHHLYRGATVMSLNLKEALAVDGNFRVPAAVAGFAALRAALGIDNIVVKLGAQGSVAILQDKVWRTPACAVAAVDACGAGDAFLAALAVTGIHDPAKALAFANLWAGLSTERHGTEPPTLAQLL